MLEEFKNNIGRQFKVHGTNIVDHVASVNEQEEMIIGEKYGEFHVEQCSIKRSHVKPPMYQQGVQQRIFQ